MARILLIGDDPILRIFLRSALESAGHHVLETDDGKLGTRVYAIDPVDLVFCDIIMPDTEGLETIRALVWLDPAAKIIAMSGGHKMLEGLNLPALAGKFGACRFLTKPFSVAQILQAVEEVLALETATALEPIDIANADG